MRIAKPLALIGIIVCHAFLFLYMWLAVGATTLTSVGSATGSFYLASIAASIATALLVTAPTGFLSGFLSDKRNLAIVVASFPIGWTALSIYFSGVSLSISEIVTAPRVFEFASVTIVGLAFVTLGMRAKARRREMA